MKKYLHLFLLLFVFSGMVNAQPGPLSTANWFGYILPPNPAEYKYISFTMQDLGSVSVASDVLPAVTTATFANSYVWSVNNDNGYIRRFRKSNPLVQRSTPIRQTVRFGLKQGRLRASAFPISLERRCLEAMPMAMSLNMTLASKKQERISSRL